MIADLVLIGHFNFNLENNSPAIGYNGYNDPPEITELINKYIDRDGLFDSVIRNKLEGVYNDIGWVLNLNPFKAKFFNFS